MHFYVTPPPTGFVKVFWNFQRFEIKKPISFSKIAKNVRRVYPDLTDAVFI